MEQQDDQQRRPRWTRGRIGAAGAIGLGLIGIFVLAGVVWLTPDRAAGRPVELLQLHPVHKPPATSAASTWLPDEAPVIGVTARDRHRAYAICAFGNIDEHVVNDLVGGVPITVTYCNRTGCTKVFTSTSSNRTLDVAVGGWVGEPGSSTDGVMLLRVDSNYYLQNTGEQLSGWSHFPYQEAEFERTTWGKWRRAHPDTDVVTGPRRNIEVDQ
jgi:hypothetical protein